MHTSHHPPLSDYLPLNNTLSDHEPPENVPLQPLQYQRLAYDESMAPSAVREDGGQLRYEGFSYGRRRRPRTMVWLPAFGVALCSFGIAASMLAWLYKRRVHQHLPSEDEQFRGALVVIESTSSAPTKNADGTLSLNATLYGLTIATIATKFVSFVTPIVIGALTLRLAANWIRAQEQRRAEAMPTAAQYGLIIKLCSSPSLTTIYEAVKYLSSSGSRRANASPVLLLAVAVVVLMLVISYALSIADIWLHSTSIAFMHTEVSDIPSDTLPYLGSQINLAVCEGPQEVYTSFGKPSPDGNVTNCAHFETGTTHSQVAVLWGNPSLLAEGLEAVKNQSTAFRSIIVGDYAVLVSTSTPPNQMNVTFNTFGISARCAPVLDCNIAYTEPAVFCPSFSPPINNTFAITGSTVNSSVQPYNLTGNLIANTGTGEPGSWYGYPPDSILNPYGALVTLGWGLSAGSIQFPVLNSGVPGWYNVPLSGFDLWYYLAGCTVSAYNVSLLYSAGESSEASPTYTLRSDPILSNFNTASALFAALDEVYQQNLVQYLQSTLQPSLNVSTDTFTAILSGNLSYAMMALASPLFMPLASTGGTALTQRVASRYEVVPLYLFAALLLIYGLLALILCISAALALSREIISQGPIGSTAHGPTRTEAEHIHLRLNDPLFIVAERFAEPGRQGLLLETSALQMFGEHPGSEHIRVVVDEVAGAEVSERPLGLFRRWRAEDDK